IDPLISQLDSDGRARLHAALEALDDLLTSAGRSETDPPSPTDTLQEDH
ncbi:MAG: hypothetical protein QOK15_1034, partial [Nocardioidaceae bacterium]|nr:hypothetical protein [Nocardioidaceae bacterium]